MGVPTQQELDKRLASPRLRRDPAGRRHRSRSDSFVLIALAVGVLFWVFESALHAFVFDEGSLLEQMFMPAGHEAWMRLLVMALFFAFGVFIQSVVNQRRRTEANLEHRVDERTRELAQRTEELAVLNYRERLSRELHDAVTQTLFSASLMAEALPRMWDSDPERARRQLGEIARLTRSALAELRVLLLDLRPAALADGDVEKLLRQLVESLGGRSGLTIDVEVEGACQLPAQARAAVYRIAHEALNNAVKHAGASRASLKLSCGPKRIELSIEDDGCGFEPREVRAGKLGLGIMRERAEASGGTLQIRSQVGSGTRLRAVWTARDSPV